ncbi:MAG: InlB B-repeat-containing protein [Peptococcaceae bacterium]|nr:InlB B-repeat-containing protein [Peptococcaceae bacterium]
MYDVSGVPQYGVTQFVTSGDWASEPEPPPTRAGYVFEGWHKEQTLVTLWEFDNDTVTQDITLYAKWSVRLVPPDDGGGTRSTGCA